MVGVRIKVGIALELGLECHCLQQRPRMSSCIWIVCIFLLLHYLQWAIQLCLIAIFEFVIVLLFIVKAMYQHWLQFNIFFNFSAPIFQHPMRFALSPRLLIQLLSDKQL